MFQNYSTDPTISQPNGAIGKEFFFHLNQARHSRKFDELLSPNRTAFFLPLQQEDCTVLLTFNGPAANRIFQPLTNEKATAEKLLQINAVALSPDEPFTWASGWKSPIYCDNRKILSFPYIRDFVKSEMCSVIFSLFPEADLLAGVATAGIPWGAMAADQLKLPYIYVRPKPKEHGLGNQIEGSYKPGARVLVIEDLVSTGKSSLQVVNVLRAAGLRIEGMVSIFTYGFPEADQAFAEAGVKYIPLTNYTTLIETALEKGLINPEQQRLLNEWRLSPSTWMRS